MDEPGSFLNTPPVGALKKIGSLILETYSRWGGDNASLLAAGLSYFTVFSLAPLGLLSIAVTELALSRAAAEGLVARQLEGVLSAPVADAVQDLIVNARRSGMETATVLGAALLLFGASQIFLQLQTALNMIWGVERAPEGLMVGVRRRLRKRLISFPLVLGVGALSTAFFVVDAAL